MSFQLTRVLVIIVKVRAKNTWQAIPSLTLTKPENKQNLGAMARAIESKSPTWEHEELCDF
jgi:hypothetical protein